MSRHYHTYAAYFFHKLRHDQRVADKAVSREAMRDWDEKSHPIYLEALQLHDTLERIAQECWIFASVEPYLRGVLHTPYIRQVVTRYSKEPL